MNPQDSLHYTPVNNPRFLISKRLSKPQFRLRMTLSENVLEQIDPDTNEDNLQKTSSAVMLARQNPCDIFTPKLIPTPVTRWCLRLQQWYLRLQQKLSEGTRSNKVYHELCKKGKAEQIHNELSENTYEHKSYC